MYSLFHIDFDGANGKHYIHSKNNQPYYYQFDIPDSADFMKNVEEMELELGLDRADFVPMSYRNAALKEARCEHRLYRRMQIFYHIG